MSLSMKGVVLVYLYRTSYFKTPSSLKSSRTSLSFLVSVSRVFAQVWAPGRSGTYPTYIPTSSSHKKLPEIPLFSSLHPFPYHTLIHTKRKYEKIKEATMEIKIKV